MNSNNETQTTTESSEGHTGSEGAGKANFMTTNQSQKSGRKAHATATTAENIAGPKTGDSVVTRPMTG